MTTIAFTFTCAANGQFMIRECRAAAVIYHLCLLIRFIKIRKDVFRQQFGQTAIVDTDRLEKK
jgi:hypothetical protein